MFDIKTTPRFNKASKKLAKGNASIATKIVESMDAIRTNPYIGDLKHGDLKGIRCLDFYVSGTNYELAYDIEEDEDGNITIVLLLLIGTRENFYNELKRFL